MKTAWLCLTLSRMGLAWNASAWAEPIRVGSEKQIVFGPWAEDGRDDFLVQSMRNVTMTMNETHVTGERMIPYDKPWDRGDIWLCVLKDEDRKGTLRTPDDMRATGREGCGPSSACWTCCPRR